MVVFHVGGCAPLSRPLGTLPHKGGGKITSNPSPALPFACGEREGADGRFPRGRRNFSRARRFLLRARSYFSRWPLNFRSEPLNLGSWPLNFSSEPLDFSSAPLNFSSAPLNFSSWPLNFSSEPLNFSGAPRFSVGPGTKKSGPAGPDLRHIPWSCRLPFSARPVQAALPLPPSASLAARRRRVVVPWPLNRLDSPARSALRPWLLPEIFSRP